MVRDTDAMQRAVPDISGPEDFIHTWLPEMKTFITMVLRAEWLLHEALGWYRNDAHRAECTRAKQNAKRLDTLAATELASITTDDYIDRRASILPGTPRRGEDEGPAPAPAPTTPAASKMTTLPSDVYSYTRIQRLVYTQCSLSTKKHFPGLLSDINVSRPQYGTEAMRMVIDVIAPRNAVNVASSRSKYEAYFASLQPGDNLYKFFEGALQLSMVLCYYEEREHDSALVADRTVTAMYSIGDSLLMQRLEGFKVQARTLECAV